MQVVEQVAERSEGRVPRGGRRREPPVRTCIVTRESHPVDALLRFCVDPSGVVVPDVDRKLPGRGFWLLARRDIVRAARDRNIFSKAARSRVTCPADLDDRVAAQLARRCLDLVGMARRAGQAWCGFEQVRAALAADRVGVLLAASDSSAEGRRKLGVARPGVVSLGLLDGAALGSVFGRDRLVHVAVARGPLAERLKSRARQLSGFETTD